MHPYVAFFNEDVPLRQLKDSLENDGFENIDILHFAGGLVFDTENYGDEAATKLEHILEEEFDEDGFVIVRSRVRLSRLLQENPLLDECQEYRTRFLLFERPLIDSRKQAALAWAEPHPSFRLRFGREGGYLCFKGETDRLKRGLSQIEEKLRQPALAVTEDMVERAIEVVGEHEARLEASL
ncbi:MAG TPA: DUF1697 domain-containing protein [Tissierellia bacterium]|nr:DUF1697 domain-containing protein [Tissierellia bacterium]